MKKIVLTGYMGSGKSSVGRMLEQITGKKFVDLDAEIEQEQQSSISDIFEKYGELYFRKLEHRKVNEIVASDAAFILALGGGTPCYFGNEKILTREDVASFYLLSNPNEILSRINNDQNVRPILKTIPEHEREEFIAKHLFERMPFYSHAKYTVNTNGKDVESIAREILAKLTEIGDASF